jgi:hypothetical protein
LPNGQDEGKFLCASQQINGLRDLAGVRFPPPHQLCFCVLLCLAGIFTEANMTPHTCHNSHMRAFARAQIFIIRRSEAARADR